MGDRPKVRPSVPPGRPAFVRRLDPRQRDHTVTVARGELAQYTIPVQSRLTTPLPGPLVRPVLRHAPSLHRFLELHVPRMPILEPTLTGMKLIEAPRRLTRRRTGQRESLPQSGERALDRVEHRALDALRLVEEDQQRFRPRPLDERRVISR